MKKSGHLRGNKSAEPSVLTPSENADFRKRMQEVLGAEATAFFEVYEAPPCRAIRINSLKGSVERFLKENPWGITKEDRVPFCQNGFSIGPDGPDGNDPYHLAGAFYFQEPSAMAPVEALAIMPNDRVLDLCAAPGGKSTQAAAYLGSEGLLVANEPHRERARVLSENIERLGIGGALVLSQRPEELTERFAGFFTKIIVDAPCSGEGMFRKNPAALSEWSLENVTLCAARQRQILESAYRMLAPGGRLLYATCTFERAENEDNVAWLLMQHPDLTMQEQRTVYPHRERGEGQFYAVLQRAGSAEYERTVLPPGGGIEASPLSDFREYAAFAADCLEVGADPYFEDAYAVRFGDELSLVRRNFPSLRGVKVLRPGLHLGTLKKNYFLPSHALAHYLRPEQFRSICALSEESAGRYLRGEALRLDAPIDPGWVLCTYRGYSLGFGKCSGGIIKNHYPKGLRIGG